MRSAVIVTLILLVIEILRLVPLVAIHNLSLHRGANRLVIVVKGTRHGASPLWERLTGNTLHDVLFDQGTLREISHC